MKEELGLILVLRMMLISVCQSIMLGELNPRVRIGRIR